MIISLHIMADTDNGQILSAPFSYHQEVTPTTNGYRLDNQFVITPYTVRQVILYALVQGWKPLERGAPFHVSNIDDKIDLRLDQNKEHRIKTKIEQGASPNPLG